MAKKNRPEKELSRLRRQLEVLKAQRAHQLPSPPDRSPAPPPNPAAESKNETPLKSLEKSEISRVDPKFIKKDLRKTGLLFIAGLLLILAIYLLRQAIPF